MDQVCQDLGRFQAHSERDGLLHRGVPGSGTKAPLVRDAGENSRRELVAKTFSFG